jgi:hypothetical protein
VPLLRIESYWAVEELTLNYTPVTPHTMGINPVDRVDFSYFLMGTLTPSLFARYFPLLRLFRVISLSI